MILEQNLKYLLVLPRTSHPSNRFYYLYLFNSLSKNQKIKKLMKPILNIVIFQFFLLVVVLLLLRIEKSPLFLLQ